MLFKSIVSATLLASVIAAPLQHNHHNHKDNKRDVVVTQTQVVYVTAGAAAPTPAASTVAVAKAAVAVSSSAAASVVVSASTSVASSASAASSVASSTASSSGSFDGGAKGITYSPYADDGTCKSSSTIATEVAALSGFSIIRLYGVDCDQVSAVLAAKASGQKIFAGIYYVDAIASGISTLAAAVAAEGSWSDIHSVSIGNELVNGGAATTSQVESYVSTGRSALTAAGFTGPVVSVDTFIAVINNPALCDYSDYIAVNAHAFFDGGVTAENAGKWVLEQIQRVSTACGSSKSVLITESGWPSQGESNSVAVPSVANQAAAIASIKSACGDDTILFTAYNDLWKSPGSYNAEQYWGILN